MNAPQAAAEMMCEKACRVQYEVSPSELNQRDAWLT